MRSGISSLILLECGNFARPEPELLQNSALNGVFAAGFSAGNPPWAGGRRLRLEI